MSTRTFINHGLLEHEEGHGVRTFAQLLGISKGAVKRVLRSRSAEVPRLERAEIAASHHDRIVELLRPCKGNLVRVHEELCAAGAEFSYQALTAYCRRHGIGHTPAVPAGHYDFEPGQEMQHDTSPHVAEIGGRRLRVQTASLVLCHSRMRCVQMCTRFTRFERKLFLPTHQDFFARLLRAQWHAQQENALAWRIDRAGLPERWTLESFPFKKQPGVSQKQIRGFAELDFIGKAENIVLVGPTGVGKTGLASGLLLKALQSGHRHLCPCPRSLRRDVRLARGPLEPKAHQPARSRRRLGHR